MTATGPGEAERTEQAFNDLRAQIEALRQDQARLDATLRARTALDQQKVQADIDKAGIETRKLQSELDPTANSYEKGIKELAKLEAEKRKLDHELDPRTNNYEKGIKELAKLEAEKRKLDHELDPRTNNYERGIKELAKLEAEKRKLDYEFDPAANNYRRGIKELAKLDAENDKLDMEKRKLSSDRFTEWVKTIGTIALAGAAILTWWVTSTKNEQDKDARYRADAAHLIESLGVPQAPQLRAAAAIGLRSFINDERTRALVLGSLAYSLGIESHLDVQYAMSDSLVAAGPEAVPLLNQMIARVNGEVETGLDRLGDVADCRGHEKELDPITAQQNAMTAAVLALRRLGKGPVPDFSGLNLKCFKLHPLGDQLRGAVLQGAGLWNADFYNMDLRGTDFSGVHAFAVRFNKAKLQGANFSHADLEMADFTGASVDGAQFVDADLDGADLSGSIGLTEPQLRSAAHLYCAKLPPVLATTMAQELKPLPGTRCQ
jgi:soluble cytochrome b562